MPALLDLPWWCRYLGVCPLPWTETPIAVQIERDALEQMSEVVDPKAAALEHFELIVQPFDKAAGLALPEVVGNRIQPRVQRLSEGIRVRQSARLHRPLPAVDAAEPFGFGAGRIEDGGELFPQVVRLLEFRSVLEQ